VDVRSLAAACLAAAVLGPAACDVETDGCTPTRLLVDATDASEPAQLRLSARLVTEAGDPVPGRVVDFAVRTGPDAIALSVGAGETGPDGVVQADAYAEALPFRQVQEALASARLLYVEYENPDDLNAGARPNYCSAETTVDFRWRGTFPPP
jgi:hypothetical protein